MKFRKKPVVIEAIQFLPSRESADAIMELAAGGGRKVHISNNEGQYSMVIGTLEGDMEARIGDWIIKGVSGELYPCKPDIFLKTYEVAE
jgi:hypothetical protein